MEVVTVPFAVIFMDPFEEETAPEVVRLAPAPVVVKVSPPPTADAPNATAPAFVTNAVPGFPVLTVNVPALV